MRAAGTIIFVTVLLCLPPEVRGQANTGQANTAQSANGAAQTSTLENTMEAGDDELGKPLHPIVKWNEFDIKFSSFRFGAGFLYEYAAYAQDDASKQQFELEPLPKLRDTRILFSGKLKTNRAITWSTGIMYEQATQKLLFRQTQIMVEVPEIWGNIVVGRTKEGVSLNKVMVGYAGWTMERATVSDAMIPILADGIKWLGHIPEKHLLWNAGFFMDAVSQNQSFSTYSKQAAFRIVWLPRLSEEEVLHVGLNLRYGTPKDGALQLRSRPEAFPAPFFVDTGKYPVKSTTMSGIEAYYRPGALLVGTEYYFQKQNSPDKGDPLFHGGDVFVSWLATGEVRRYNTVGGYFDQISPTRSIYQGGPGAWEFVGRLSFIDLDDGPVRGGKFWRFTPMVNWHMSDNIRLEFTYGYGSLDRFDLTGKTEFLQTRIQLQF